MSDFDSRMSELKTVSNGYYHQDLIREMQQEISKCVERGDWGPAEAMRKAVQAIEFLEIRIGNMAKSDAKSSVGDV